MLTYTACKNAKAEQKQCKNFDGGGAYLLVRPNGSKLWQLKYSYLGKGKTCSIGKYPEVSLSPEKPLNPVQKLKYPPAGIPEIRIWPPE
jgi:hypothetical protein